MKWIARNRSATRRLTVIASLGFILLWISGSARAANPPITACGATISVPGNYTVGKNLTSAGTDCITIAASEVALDLKGHTLKGNGSAAGITDGGVSFRDIIITNGTITGFNVGISLGDSQYGTLAKLNVSNNTGDGIEVNTTHSSSSTFTNVKANNNGGNGIATRCCSTFTNVTANGNGG